MAITYISSIASMIRNLASPSGRTSPSPKPSVTIYAGVVKTINVTSSSTNSANNHSQSRRKSNDHTNKANADDMVGRVYMGSTNKNGQRVHFASPLYKESEAYVNDLKLALAKSERLALIRQRRLARRMKQQAEGGRRWNRVLRNRLAAGL